jgi:hypothetical protein
LELPVKTTLMVSVTPRFPKHHSRIIENVGVQIKKKVLGALMQKVDFSRMATSGTNSQITGKMVKEMVDKYNYDDNVKEKVDKMLSQRHMAKAIVTENKYAMPNFKDIA